MTTRLYDVRETSLRIRRSPSWLYRNAGKTIPVTQHAPGGRLFWTEEQIRQIIALGAVEPGAKTPAPQGKRRPATKTVPAAVGKGTVTPLTARPEARRKGRRSA